MSAAEGKRGPAQGEGSAEEMPFTVYLTRAKAAELLGIRRRDLDQLQFPAAA